jgi:hypothetical protein
LKASVGAKPIAKQPKQKQPQTVTPADVARELNINPKLARAKARRRSDELPETMSDDNWIFDAKLKSKLVAFLNS